MQIPEMYPVGIIGASGYTGLELIKIIALHPRFMLTYLATSEGGTTLHKLHPSLRWAENDIKVSKVDIDEMPRLALVFLALPHKTSMQYAKKLLEKGVKVVDLSADYRLELDTYEKHYCKHEDTKNLPNAVYGLPEFYSNEIREASLVANPGCYPTAALLALLPFAKYIDESFPIFIDAKSGVSGAGKKCSDSTQYVSINENIFAYNPLIHRHQPEIVEKLKELSGKEFDINFVPHLIPATRGEMVDSYMLLKEEVDPLALLKEFYKDHVYIRIFDTPVNIKACSGTHFCDIFAKRDGKKLYLNSAIDNILRGASSQAVVNANLMLGIIENEGIPYIPYTP